MWSVIIAALFAITTPSLANEAITVEEAKKAFESEVQEAKSAHLEELKKQRDTADIELGKADNACRSAIAIYEKAYRETASADEALAEAEGKSGGSPGLDKAWDTYIAKLKAIKDAARIGMNIAMSDGKSAAASYASARDAYRRVNMEIVKLDRELNPNQTPLMRSVDPTQGFTTVDRRSRPVPYNAAFAGCPDYKDPPAAELGGYYVPSEK